MQKWKEKKLYTLVVEDDPASLYLISQIMNNYGQCETAANGIEAIEKFKKAFESDKRFDLVCLDIMMPDMDGHSVLTNIRNFENSKEIYGSDGVKVIMITALGDSKNIMSSFKEQCDGYIVKPVNKDKIEKQLEELFPEE